MPTAMLRQNDPLFFNVRLVRGRSRQTQTNNPPGLHSVQNNTFYLGDTEVLYLISVVDYILGGLSAVIIITCSFNIPPPPPRED